MAPVLQTPRGLAIGILLRLLFLRKVPLAVRDHTPHVRYVVLVIMLGVLLRVLLQDLDDLAPTSQVQKQRSVLNGTLGSLRIKQVSRPFVSICLAGAVFFGPAL